MLISILITNVNFFLLITQASCASPPPPSVTAASPEPFLFDHQSLVYTTTLLGSIESYPLKIFSFICHNSLTFRKNLHSINFLFIFLKHVSYSLKTCTVFLMKNRIDLDLCKVLYVSYLRFFTQLIECLRFLFLIPWQCKPAIPRGTSGTFVKVRVLSKKDVECNRAFSEDTDFLKSKVSPRAQMNCVSGNVLLTHSCPGCFTRASII